MKYKVLEPWEIFWKKVFDYIIQNKLSAYDVFFYVAIVPNVFHMQHKKLQKFLDTIINLYELPNDYAIASVYYVMRIIDTYAEYGYLPEKNYKDCNICTILSCKIIFPHLKNIPLKKPMITI